jgi:hypothetical protein
LQGFITDFQFRQPRLRAGHKLQLCL